MKQDTLITWWYIYMLILAAVAATIVVIGFALTLTSACHAAPLVGVHFNQWTPADPVPSPIDVAFIQTNNSPAGINWRDVVKRSKATKVLINSEGIDRNQLFTGWGDPSKATIKDSYNDYPWKKDGAFVYYEFPVYTLTPDDVDLAYSMLKLPIYPLYRTYDRQPVIDSMFKKPVTAGGFFEIGADDLDNIKNQQTAKWIDFVASRKKTPVLLLPPGHPGPYVHNVIRDLVYLRDNAKYFDKCIILFAVYDRKYTGIDFKRVQSAVTVFRYNFK